MPVIGISSSLPRIRQRTLPQSIQLLEIVKPGDLSSATEDVSSLVLNHIHPIITRLEPTKIKDIESVRKICDRYIKNDSQTTSLGKKWFKYSLERFMPEEPSELENLSSALIEKGEMALGQDKIDIASLLYSQSLKTLDRIKKNNLQNGIDNTSTNEQIIKTLKKSYAIHELDNDKLHMLSRVFSIGKMYKEIGNETELTKMNIKRHSLLRDILDDYEGATANFKSISKKPLSFDEAELMLGHVANRLGETYYHNSVKINIKEYTKSLKYFKEAKEIFTKHGVPTESIDNYISKIEGSLTRPK